MSLVSSNASMICSLGLPTTAELVHGATRYGYISFGVASVCVFFTLLIYTFEVVRIVKFGDDWRQHEFALWLLGVFPFYAFMAWVAVIVPRVSYDVDLVLSLYVSVCLVLFLKMLLHYVGGDDVFCRQYAGRPVPTRSLPCGCCLVCWDEPLLSRAALFRVKLLVWQTVVVRPAVAFILIIMIANGGELGNTQHLTGRSPALWLQITGTVSMLVAVYGLIIVIRMLRDALSPYNVIAKFLLLKVALLLSHAQQFLFSILSTTNALPCTPTLPAQGRAEAVNHLVITVEMLLMAIIGIFVFQPSMEVAPEPDAESWAEPANDANEKRAITRQPAASQGMQLSNYD